MASQYNTIPPGVLIQPTPFKISIPETQLTEFRTLLSLSKIPPPTLESLDPDSKYGITHKWLTEAKSHWLNNFSWRKHEEEMNSFPDFIIPLQDGNDKFDIHFVSLFSQNPAAIPILLLHGWPGSFLEFLPMLGLIASQYTPDTLPYHFIAPSLPGYAFSSKPPLDKDFQVQDIASVMNTLMTQLGFERYVVQGGDIGSKVARVLIAEHEGCVAAHLNFGIMPQPPGVSEDSYTELEKQGVKRGQEFRDTGSAYALLHATRPSTISFSLSASPLSLLPWLAEKFLTWSDPTTVPSLDLILQETTLYWFTDTFSTSIYPYRQLFTPGLIGAHENPKWKIPRGKGFGFSWFPYEIAPVPKSWVETTTEEGKVGWWREHGHGGHFAALEGPGVLWGDLREFVEEVVVGGVLI